MRHCACVPADGPSHGQGYIRDTVDFFSPVPDSARCAWRRGCTFPNGSSSALCHTRLPIRQPSVPIWQVMPVSVPSAIDDTTGSAQPLGFSDRRRGESAIPGSSCSSIGLPKVHRARPPQADSADPESSGSRPLPFPAVTDVAAPQRSPAVCGSIPVARQPPAESPHRQAAKGQLP